MSAPQTRTYVFGTAKQWGACVLHRIDVGPDGHLGGIARLGSHAYVRVPATPAALIAADRYGRALWRLEGSAVEATRLQRFSELDAGLRTLTIFGAAASGTRWIADRHWLWAFCPGTARISRYDLASAAHDLSLDVTEACGHACGEAVAITSILDIAGDGRDGVWLLAVTSGDQQRLVHIDCEGRSLACWPLPCEAGQASELACTNRGATLALLVAGGRRLAFVRTADGASTRIVRPGGANACWAAARITSDARNRIALWDPGDASSHRAASLLVVDGDGDLLDGPLDTLFGPRSPQVMDIAIHRDTVWLASDGGVWSLDPSERSGTQEATSELLTPALVSQPSDAGRGWLRAELDVALPAGAVLEARFAGTDDARLADQAIHLAGDRSSTAQRRQEAIWTLLEDSVVSTVRITGPTLSGPPIAIPLFQSQHRWLWLGVRIVTPPGVDPPTLATMRVLYPDVSLAARLPAMFRGDADDPGSFLRRLVGVLETTTQQLDERIAALGSNILPDKAPADWLDFLAGWLDLPWDDALPETAKRALLASAGLLIAQRGTREGLAALLRALVDAPRGSATISDVTVDYPLLRVGGRGRAAPALPGLLAGASRRAATLNAKAVIGVARLSCQASDCDPAASVVPMVRADVYAEPRLRAELAPLMSDIVGAYVPAGVRVAIRWRPSPRDSDTITDAGYVVDATGPGALGADAAIGRVMLAGRAGLRLDSTGIGMGFPLQ